MSEVKNNSTNKSVYLGLGSNIDPSRNIVGAIDQLKIYFDVVCISNIWESEAEGSSGPDFLNAVVQIYTELAYSKLKRLLREIEGSMGRVRSKNKFAPRPIDIDILIYKTEIIDPDIWTQVYLAIPLAEVYPTLIHEETGENILNIAKALPKNIIHRKEGLLE